MKLVINEWDRLKFQFKNKKKIKKYYFIMTSIKKCPD